jgi:hypothetical protein
MALKSDAQGFLMGTPVELSGFQPEMTGIQNDVRAIRRALMSKSRDRPFDSRTVATPSGRGRSRGIDSAPAVTAGSALRVATPSGRGSLRASPGIDMNRGFHRDSIGMPGRMAAAATEAAKAVANEESDASVKAFNEIAQPLKRGWATLRGGRADARQEGWLKRIFRTLRGRKEGLHFDGSGSRAAKPGATHFDRAREHAVTRDAQWRDRGTRETTGTYATRGSEFKARRESGAPSGWGGGSGETLSLQAIEKHLKSLDKKVKAPKGDGIFMRILPIFTSFLPALLGWLREMRMDSNLDRIEGHTRKQLEVSTPFYAFVRRRLIAIGEAIDEPDHADRSGGFLRALLSPLLMALAGLSAKLARIPLIGPALAGLTRLLGGRTPIVLPRGRRVADPGGSASPAAAVAVGRSGARWGKMAEGIRGNRAARVGRVALRNAGRALRPLGRVLTKVPVLGSLLALGMGAAGSASIEKDDALSRDQKNAAQGKNWGGVAGGFGGAALGAALGTAIAPGIGTVVGGVLGAVLGEWLGGNLGEMLGEKFSAFMAPVSVAFGEIKIWALATWDWIRDGATEFYGGALKVFTSVGEWINERWTALVDTVTGIFDSFVGGLKVVLSALKNVPIIGDAIGAAEAAANAAAELAKSAAGKAKEVAGNAIEGATDTAGKAWHGAKEGLKSLIPKGVRDRVAHERALETAAEYKQGNIGRLDDAHTRELVASTALTESAGGKLGVVNSAGYLGRYQAGAGWLADAGLIRGGSAAVTAAMKKDGFKNEYKWGESGGMTRFLRNDANWNGGLSRAQYLASSDVQDKAFRTNSNRAYEQLVADGTITKAHTQEQIAGLLKARHIAGIGGAKAVAAGGTGKKDANGTSARDYFNDLAGRDAQFAGAFASGADSSALSRTPVAPVVVSTKAPAPPPAPPPPPIPDAPQVQVPLGSGPASKPVVVQMQQPDAGQDVRDRGIAHIATGGLARA